MSVINANELKTTGISSIAAALSQDGEARISVRGKERYVVMDMETYNHLRELELEAALHEARQELADGKGIQESVEQHMARLRDEPACGG